MISAPLGRGRDPGLRIGMIDRKVPTTRNLERARFEKIGIGAHMPRETETRAATFYWIVI